MKVCLQVREVKEELRSMRLEAHTKQLTKELKGARAALDNERKLRKVQSDTIKVSPAFTGHFDLVSRIIENIYMTYRRLMGPRA